MTKRVTITALFLYAALLGACTKSFEDINKNPYDFHEDELKPDLKLLGEPLVQTMLNIMVSNDPATAQVQQNLVGDVYSGYMMTPTPFESNRNNTTYDLLDNWNNHIWTVAYGNVMPNCRFVQEKSKGRYSDFYAWAQLLRVVAMHRVSDVYGPVIYTKYGIINPDGSIDYDSQQEAYNAFFRDLSEAIDTLTLYASRPQRNFTAFDLAYGGDYAQWVKFANSLRLRLAIRISKVDPAKARTEGEAALQHPLGLLSGPADNFNINISPVAHPLFVICYKWNDIRMGAPMESIMTGYHDPRLPYYFLYSDSRDSSYNGIRNGINITSRDTYNGFSKLSLRQLEQGKIQLMTAAETWFLKAEAALYGWEGAGDAGSNYNEGIRASFAQYQLEDKYAAYASNNTYTARPYTDPKNADNNVPAGSPYLSNITIRWDPGATPAQKLERIITQKWIAMFPEGEEAWAEFRRTGYPKLFPVVLNYSNGKISTEQFIRRINFCQLEYATNPQGVARALQALGGPDNGGTRLWWDRE
ncbi:SusD/RagB family nutrient-binding outer membrane lipoprotein [Chitinophaga japonensis]|uniref:SusD/RagB-like outer membrane lipoprotein n=1 Tax=Chitinophaga japonensis TaxID=104662 RepID=A0A562T4E8_CHIJA|nr:SusD/RagB family nutrient-binding outer membrane lipoprotein [Chitinophaga japonensis]TWI88382.1 SusD/RagB-like outer membrane lipoprotein [Chitinophaga japonensis]